MCDGPLVSTVEDWFLVCFQMRGALSRRQVFTSCYSPKSLLLRLNTMDNVYLLSSFFLHASCNIFPSLSSTSNCIHIISSTMKLLPARFLPLIFTLLATSALALLPRQNGCTNPTIRREWSSVSQETRDSYTDAVMCMSRTRSKIGLSTSRFDDFTWVHRAMFDDSQLNWFEKLWALFRS